MLSRLMDFLTACWRRRSFSDGKGGSEVTGRKEGLLWYKDAGQHLFGEYSMAVVQANNLLEDQSQIESGPLSLLDTGPYGTFVGVYDGHGGPETSRYVCDHLFQHLKRNGFFSCYYDDPSCRREICRRSTLLNVYHIRLFGYSSYIECS